MIFGTVLAVAVIANLAVTIPLLNYLLFNVIEGGSKALQESRSMSNAMRITVIIVMTIFGVCIPFFNEMLGIVSAVVIVIGNLVIPSVFKMKFNSMESKGCTASLPQIVTLLIAVVLSASGLIAIMKSLQDKVAANPEELNPIASFWK